MYKKKSPSPNGSIYFSTKLLQVLHIILFITSSFFKINILVISFEICCVIIFIISPLKASLHFFNVVLSNSSFPNALFLSHELNSFPWQLLQYNHFLYYLFSNLAPFLNIYFYLLTWYKQEL